MAIFKINNIFRSTRFERIESELTVFQIKLNSLKPDPKHSEITDKCVKYLKEAQDFLDDKNIDATWKCLHAAKSLMILTLKDFELETEGITIRNEASKLSGWRKNAVEDLIGKVDTSVDKLTKENIHKAALIRDEHYTNVAYKNTLFRNYLNRLSKILAAVMLGIIIYFLTGIEVCNTNCNAFIGVIIFGFFGGVVSASINIPSKKSESKIPEQMYTSELSLFRILVGGASAIFVYVVIQTPFGTKLIEGFTDDTELSNYLIFVISFVAGFSERLVLNAVSLVAKDKK